MRVVSLLPAATEIVAALGAVGRLVGVSHECDFPPEVRSLPRVTRTRIDPALPSGAIDRAMAEAKGAGVSPVEVDVNLVAHLRPDVLIGQSVCDVCAVGEGELARVVATLMPTPYVAGHWVPELVALAGGQDVGSAPGERSRARPWEELAALAPEVVVVALCGFDIPRAQAELGAVTDGAARTLLGRRVEFLDGNAYTSRPGPRLVDAAETLARLIRG